jgi:hypothetical protein
LPQRNGGAEVALEEAGSATVADIAAEDAGAAGASGGTTQVFRTVGLRRRVISLSRVFTGILRAWRG